MLFFGTTLSEEYAPVARVSWFAPIGLYNARPRRAR